MTNIWGFALQTMTVSLVAVVLLAIKWLLADKLSPRWQYGIWSILALRILIPAVISRRVVLDLGLWLETWKAWVETGLSSAYSAVYTPITISFPLPWIIRPPESVTDWLFVVYTSGVVLSLLWYLGSYTVLRLRLRRGTPAGPETQARIANVRLRHWLKPWKVVEVEGLPSAFVCGIFRPMLVVPAGQAVDEKVLLHELLHLHYRDAAQNVCWTVLRCLHWCNPFLHYVFNRIENDMESLCDQRVLERLEGEERREYGMILLTMANGRYARAPGTTSISNGGRNIARRIAAIVRFKKYPRGMALVSICIALVLLSPMLVGSAAAYDNDLYEPDIARDLPQAMAVARVRRCTTAAGAVDTYAKGILRQNGIYIASASPLKQHPQLQQQMEHVFHHESWVAWHMDPGYGLEHLDSSKGYSVYDLMPDGEGGYTCYIVFGVMGFDDPDYQDWPTTTDGVEIVAGSVAIPLQLWQEDGAWVVRERGERILANMRYDQIEFYGDDIPWLAERQIPCETGTVTITHRTVWQVDNRVVTNGIFGWTSYDYDLKPDAEFTGGWMKYRYSYQMDPDCPLRPRETAALEILELDSVDQTPVFEDLRSGYGLSGEFTAVSGGTNFGGSYQTEWVDEHWNGIMESGGGHSLAPEEYTVFPAAYAFRICFDGKVAEEFVIGGFSHGEP